MSSNDHNENTCPSFEQIFGVLGGATTHVKEVWLRHPGGMLVMKVTSGDSFLDDLSDDKLASLYNFYGSTSGSPTSATSGEGPVDGKEAKQAPAEMQKWLETVKNDDKADLRLDLWAGFTQSNPELFKDNPYSGVAQFYRNWRNMEPEIDQTNSDFAFINSGATPSVPSEGPIDDQEGKQGNDGQASETFTADTPDNDIHTLPSGGVNSDVKENDAAEADPEWLARGEDERSLLVEALTGPQSRIFNQLHPNVQDDRRKPLVKLLEKGFYSGMWWRVPSGARTNVANPTTDAASVASNSGVVGDQQEQQKQGEDQVKEEDQGTAPDRLKGFWLSGSK